MGGDAFFNVLNLLSKQEEFSTCQNDVIHKKKKNKKRL